MCYMKIFVINLERSVVRRASIQQQLDSQGIRFEFIKAIDGSLLTDEYLATICNITELAKRPHIQKKGMYGCILSHHYIYEKIVAEDLPYAMILEDDVILQPNFKSLSTTLETKIQPNEAILLFSQNNFMPTVLSTQDVETLNESHQISYPMEPWALGSTAGYVIGRTAAQGMLKYVMPIHIGPDAWIAFYRDKAIGSLRCVTPFMVKPAGVTSEIDYVTKNSFFSNVLTFVRKYRVFPLKQLLDYRRGLALKKSSQYTFTSEVSPIAKAQLDRNYQANAHNSRSST